MTIRAKWRLADLDVDTDNPFDRVVLSTGLKVDMAGGEEAICKGIVASLHLEGALHDRGIACSLKDGGQDCLTCHVYTADPAEALAQLCRLGRDQRELEGRAEEIAEERARALREFVGPYVEMVAEHGALFALL